MNTIVNDIAYSTELFDTKLSDAEKQKRVAQEVESVFIYQLLKEMENSIDREESDILYAGQAEDSFRGLFYQQLGREIAASGGFGLSEMIEQELAAQTAEENAALTALGM